MVAGKAPRNLRRHTARILMVDEADAIEVSTEGGTSSLRLVTTTQARGQRGSALNKRSLHDSAGGTELFDSRYRHFPT